MFVSKKLICCFLLLLFGLAAKISAQTTKWTGKFIGTYATENRTGIRTLQYRPEGENFVCINGKNRFTRALYGSHTEFRLETSDRPVFATYAKDHNRHIAFKIKIEDKTIALDSLEYCKSIYKPGRRDYKLKDAILGEGTLWISTQMFYDSEGAIWQFDAKKLPQGARLVYTISEIKYKKLDRFGDIGADPLDSFEPPVNPKLLMSTEIVLSKGTSYIVLKNFELYSVDKQEGEKLYQTAETARLKIANALKIDTPDPYLNTLGGTIAMAADGCWEDVWLHGAIGWRMPLNGWRAAYMGDVLGWHDKARIHFDSYAASQVTDVKPVFSHPQQDTILNLTRSLKKWGTPMYSNGYICRNPHNNRQMHHYDMNLVYIDELLWHLKWTGDLDYARKIFPVIKLHLEWERRNWDPDGDGLYDAYAATWASDALMYNSGGTTIGSSYNYRANKIAAEIASLIGEDPILYKNEAAKIWKAINGRLWMKDKGWWAEYMDFMGNKMIHPHAGVWSVYHPIDSDVANIFQAYQATRYVDEYIPHIPVTSKDIEDGYYVISTTSWKPYAWSLNNVAFAEIGHTALAYWLSGRADEAFHLFKSALIDGMYLGISPANIGQTSYYDAARGECYRDFSDAVGVYSRAVVQGLFGIQPDLLNNKVIIKPGFPKEWNYASIKHLDVDFAFRRVKDKDTYTITNRFKKSAEITLLVKAIKDQIHSVKVNGKSVKWQLKENVNVPLVEINCAYAENYIIEIKWMGKEIVSSFHQGKGVEQSFIKKEQGQMSWWHPTAPQIEIKPDFNVNVLADFNHIQEREYVQVNIDQVLNAGVTDIFRNRYLAPRSPYTTLQTPAQGVGEWCTPKLTYKIDDTGFRAAIKNETFFTPLGIPFRVPDGKNNIAFTTLWDNYPDSITVALNGKASCAYLMMAGTTNPMQYGVTNGMVIVQYTDGTSTELELRNPDTWFPIEQDYYRDENAFKIDTPRPYRVAFKTGIVSRDMEKDMNVNPLEVFGREIKGGAGVLLAIPLDKNKELQSLRWKSVANEVIIGMLAVTLAK